MIASRFCIGPWYYEASWIQIFRINMNQVTIFDPIFTGFGIQGGVKKLMLSIC